VHHQSATVGAQHEALLDGSKMPRILGYNRRKSIMALVGQGFIRKQIAKKLSLSPLTVRNYIQRHNRIIEGQRSGTEWLNAKSHLTMKGKAK
jgi:DNA-binding NarL/FixJ family response regulator